MKKADRGHSRRRQDLAPNLLKLAISTPPVPTSYPPVPTSYPPVPGSYPPVLSLSPPPASLSPAASGPSVRSSRKKPARRRKPAVRLSVVVVARNEVRHLRRTVDCLMQGAPADAEFVVVDDGSNDGTADSVAGCAGVRLIRASGLGVARARNLGWQESRGEVVVFSDAHVEAPRDWWAPLAAVLEDASVGAAAPAIYGIGLPRHIGYGLRIRDFSLSLRWLPKRRASCYPVPVVNTCFVALRRDVLEKTGGFDAGLDTWGHTDLETSLRLWLLGWKVVVVPGLEVGHLFRPKHPYLVQWRSVLHNALRVAFVHFAPERVASVVEALRSHPSFPTALAMVAASDFASRRSDLTLKRVRDDGWFFQRFVASS